MSYQLAIFPKFVHHSCSQSSVFTHQLSKLEVYCVKCTLAHVKHILYENIEGSFMLFFSQIEYYRHIGGLYGSFILIAGKSP